MAVSAPGLDTLLRPASFSMVLSWSYVDWTRHRPEHCVGIQETKHEILIKMWLSSVASKSLGRDAVRPLARKFKPFCRSLVLRV